MVEIVSNDIPSICTHMSIRPILAALLTGALATALGAQNTPLTRATQTAVINSVIDRLGSTYIDADTGRLIGEHLRTRLNGNAYAALTNPAQFADVVTNDLRAVNGDLHLSLRYAPDGPGNASTGGGADPRTINYGIGRVEILDGNIGYLEITGFAGAPGYEEVVGDAMRLLARTDAMIIDLRRNGGGSSEMSHLIFSHFLPSTPVPTIRVQTRGRDPAPRSSVAKVPGPRRTDVPLYVLTSQGTASAGEEFSFVLKNQHRATIVGTRTAGAGHMVNGVPVGAGFIVSLSITRVTDAVSKKEWERVGVQPDVAVPPEQALDAAYAAALRAVPTSAEIARLIEVADAKRKPVTIDVARLAAFAGNYEGRIVSVVNGALTYTRREGALRQTLVPMGGNTFAIGAARLTFDDAKGQVTVSQPNGTEIVLKRTTARTSE
jgi:hypothetical protein